MRSLRSRFERWCYKNQRKGIPNLMLYIVLGNAIVTVLSMFNGGSALYELLYFDKTLILQGQVWRLITYVFAQSGYDLLGLFFLYFFYMLGRNVESSMGTFKFNLYYFSGVILMDIFAMIFSPVIPDQITSQEQLILLQNTVSLYGSMAYYLHLSLLLTFATMYPDSRFMILFVIPIKGRVIGIIYLILIAAGIFNLSYPVLYFPHNLFPLIAIANYLLFLGSDILNLLPFAWQVKLKQKKKAATVKKTGTIPFVPAGNRQSKNASSKAPYNHRCTVCGRTDVSNPELEFRYCSRCNGYHCYCEDHINNHSHIES